MTARRELREETGLTAEHWSVLVDVASSPGFSDETVRIYLARGLREVGRPDAHDEEADLTLHWFGIGTRPSGCWPANREFQCGRWCSGRPRGDRGRQAGPGCARALARSAQCVR